jgi:hypothetical protein
MKRISLGIGLLAALGGLVYWSVALGPAQEAPIETPTARINVSGEITGVTEAQSYQVHEGTTVLGLLESQGDTHGFTIDTQDYGEMGVLVTQIGDFKNGTDQKYWQYRVNDETPLVAADRLELSEGDRVEWVFEVSEY